MTVIIHDPATVQQLRQAQSALYLTDSTGAIIGEFVPRDPFASEPLLSEEEMQRRDREEGGRPLAEILADLEKRYGA